MQPIITQKTPSPSDKKQFFQQLDSLVLKISAEVLPIIDNLTEEQKQNSFIHKYFLSHRHIRNCFNNLKTLVVKIDSLIQKQLLALKPELPIGLISQTHSYLIPREFFKSIVEDLNSSSSLKNWQVYLGPISPQKASPSKIVKEIDPLELKNGIDFITQFNADAVNSEKKRGYALAKLDQIQKEAWNYVNDMPVSLKKLMVSGSRIAIFQFYSCEDTVVKETALNLLADLLSSDPLDEDSANHLIKLQKNLLEEVKANKSEDLNIKLQRLLIRCYALSIECIVLHMSFKHMNALTEDTKQQIWAGAEDLATLNVLQDKEISFYCNYAIQGAERIKGNRSEIVKLASRIALIARAGLQIYAAYQSPNADLVNGAFNDLKDSVYHIEWHRNWFEGLLSIKKLLRYAVNDVELFRQVMQIIQKKRTSPIDDNMFFGIIVALESCIMRTTSTDVQDEGLKMILQLGTMDNQLLQYRVAYALSQMTNDKGRLANTAYVLNRLLSGSNLLNSPDAQSFITEVSKPSEFTNGPIALSVIKFLIRRMADVKEGVDGSDHSLATLTASSEDKIISFIFSTLREIDEAFITPDNQGRTAYHIGAKSGDNLIIKVIQETLKIDINTRTYGKKQTALHESVLFQNEEVCEQLLKFKADPNLADRDGNTPLHIAVEREFEPLVRVLLKYKADPNKVNSAGETPFAIAVRKNSEALVKIIYQNRLSNVDSPYQASSIVQAARLKSKDVLQYLVRNKPSPLNHFELLELGWAQYEVDEHRNLLLNPLRQNQSLDLYRSGTQSTKRQPVKVRPEQLGETPLIRLAKESDSAESLASLTTLAAEKTLINKADFLGVTPLITAVVCRNYAAVEALLSNGAKINQADVHGFTPLHFAAYIRDKKIVKLLLGAKAKPNSLNDNGDSPLLVYIGNPLVRYPESIRNLAAYYNAIPPADDPEFITLLEEAGAHINQADILGNNAMHRVFVYGTETLMFFLYDQYPDLFWKKNNRDCLPIQEAIQNVRFSNVEKIIQHAGMRKLHNAILLNANLEITLGGLLAQANEAALFRELVILEPSAAILKSGDKLSTPLQDAAREDYEEILQVYLDRGLKIDTHDLFGNTAAHSAAFHNATEFLRLWIKNGLPLNTRNKGGSYPLHIAATHGYLSAASLLLSVKDLANLKDGHGDTALHLAAKHGHLNVLKLLMKEISLEVSNDDESTPLHLACQCGQLAIVASLLENKADAEAKNVYGATSLMLAAAQNHGKVVELLLAKGVDLRAQDCDGETALNKAIYAKNRTIVNMLLYKEKELFCPKDKALLNITTQTHETALFELSKRKPRSPKQAAIGAKILIDIIREGADLEQRNQNGEVFLHQVCLHGHDELLDAVVSLSIDKNYKLKTDFEAVDNKKNTIIHHAVIGNQAATLQKILKLDKVGLELRNSDGLTPLLLAVKLGNVEAAIMLATAGADQDALDPMGRNLLHLLLNRKELRPDLMHFFAGVISQKPYLIKHNDSTHSTPLHFVAHMNHGSCLDLLLRNIPGPDHSRIGYVWFKNRDGNSAYDVALANRNEELAKRIQNFPKNDLGVDCRKK